jgi:hypothetical protein
LEKPSTRQVTARLRRAHRTVRLYSCARIGPDGPIAPAPELLTLADMEYRPQALGASVRRVREVLPTTPVVVTENGIATADDTQRITFIDEALRGLAAAGHRRRRRPRLLPLEPPRQLRVVPRLPTDLRADRRRPHQLRPHSQAEPGLAGRLRRSARVELTPPRGPASPVPGIVPRPVTAAPIVESDALELHRPREWGLVEGLRRVKENSTC